MMRRLSVDSQCKSAYTCPSVWQDDADPEFVVVVGHPVLAGAIGSDEGQVVVRVRRQVVADAEIRPGVWQDDPDPDYVLVAGRLVGAGTVPTAADELAVRARREVGTVIEIG